jgi:hypothetical protein
MRTGLLITFVCLLITGLPAFAELTPDQQQAKETNVSAYGAVQNGSLILWFSCKGQEDQPYIAISALIKICAIME